MKSSFPPLTRVSPATLARTSATFSAETFPLIAISVASSSTLVRTSAGTDSLMAGAFSGFFASSLALVTRSAAKLSAAALRSALLAASLRTIASASGKARTFSPLSCFLSCLYSSSVMVLARFLI